jgi:hypothetical protein
MGLIIGTPLPGLALFLWLILGLQTLQRIDERHRIFAFLTLIPILAGIALSVTVFPMRGLDMGEHKMRQNLSEVRQIERSFTHATSLDPFSGEPLKNTGETYYSVGPDGKDDQFAFLFDPTNGTNSSGDVYAGGGYPRRWIEEMEPERIAAIAKNLRPDVRTTAEQLANRVDPFSGKRMSHLEGAYYSVGPDGEDDRLAIIYDPTNGSYSRGDIFAGGQPSERAKEAR